MKTRLLLAVLSIFLFSCTGNESIDFSSEKQDSFDDYVELAKGHSNFIVSMFDDSSATRTMNYLEDMNKKLRTEFMQSENIPDVLKTEEFYKQLTEKSRQERETSVSKIVPQLPETVKGIVERNLIPSSAKEVFRMSIKEDYSSEQILVTAIAFDSYNYWYSNYSSLGRTRSTMPESDIYDIIIADIDGGVATIYGAAAYALFFGGGGLTAAAVLTGAGISSVTEALNQYFNNK